MKLLMRVHGPEEGVHAAYALVDLTEERARHFLEWRSLARQAKATDDDFLKMEFWAHYVTWLEEAVSVLDELLDKRQRDRLWGGDPVEVPDDFPVPERFQQHTEVDVASVYVDEVYFSSYPRHCDDKQETGPIPFTLIEEAAGFREKVAP
jgi:hypothetical protein